MEILRAFHNDEAVRQKYLDRVATHKRLDQLQKGATGKGGKGCAVWCTLDAYDHQRYPLELGIPVELARLEDFIFESLPAEDAMGWPERFLSAPKLGADLRLVWDWFTHWILTEEHPDRGEHCARMGALFARRIAGEDPLAEEWDRAAGAAGAAWAAWAAGAARDARDAMDAWAAGAARDARDAMDAWAAGAARDAMDAWAAGAARDARDARAARDAWAARDARAARDAWAARDARAAWAARDARAARDACTRRMADKLISLMGQAP